MYLVFQNERSKFFIKKFQNKIWEINFPNKCNHAKAKARYVSCYQYQTKKLVKKVKIFCLLFVTTNKKKIMS